MKKASLNKLIAIYDAIGGLTSEIENPFDGMYKGGTDKLLADFTSVLEDCGVQFAKAEPGCYFVMSYIGTKDKRWGICTDRDHPDQSWCLTGFNTPEEAIAIIHDPSIFSDYNGTPIEVIDAANTSNN